MENQNKSVEQSNSEKLLDYLITFLLILSAGAIIAGIIALLVYLIFPLGNKITVKGAWIGLAVICAISYGIYLLNKRFPGLFIINRSSLKKGAYINIAVHILLLLFTFGIYLYIWIYKTSKYIEKNSDKKQIEPAADLLLCMFVPFYNLYWTYKSAKNIDYIALQKGQSSDIGVLCLILAIFIGIVPPIIIQDKINSIEK